MKNYDIIVIGGGPAGLAAAYEASKSDMNVLLIERDRYLGGILNQCIHTGFGLQLFKEELSGPEYAEKYINMVKSSTVEVMLNTMVVEIVPKDKTIIVMSEKLGRMTLKFSALILAMGCRERSRGSVIIPGSRPAGVFTAGTAQYYTNMMGDKIGKRVFILGSGDIGLIMARRMTLEGATVLGVAELQAFSSGLNRNIVQCLEDFDIPLFLSHTVVEIHGNTRLEGITIAKVDENYKPIVETKKYIPCDTLLLSVGLIPENELTRAAGITINQKTKGPVISQEMETYEEGIFACGNVAQVHDLVDFVSLEAIQAGKNAANYVLRKRDEGQCQSQKQFKQIKIEVTPQFLMVSPQFIKRENGMRAEENLNVPISKEPIQLMLRVSKPSEKGKIVVYADGNELMKIEKRFLTPGESIHIKLAADLLPISTANLLIDLVE
ncbi:NAD(P)/FAD-dependent oxidoreductase [Fusibacter bizertensis]